MLLSLLRILPHCVRRDPRLQSGRVWPSIPGSSRLRRLDFARVHVVPQQVLQPSIPRQSIARHHRTRRPSLDRPIRILLRPRFAFRLWLDEQSRHSLDCPDHLLGFLAARCILAIPESAGVLAHVVPEVCGVGVGCERSYQEQHRSGLPTFRTRHVQEPQRRRRMQHPGRHLCGADCAALGTAEVRTCAEEAFEVCSRLLESQFVEELTQLWVLFYHLYITMFCSINIDAHRTSALLRLLFCSS